MTTKAKGLIAILVLIIGAMGTYYWLTHYEYKEHTREASLKGEARKNPLYATRLFLKRMGIPASKEVIYRDASNLPNHQTVVIIDHYRKNFSATRTDKLLDWVKAGGHLIVKAGIDTPTFDEDDEDKKKYDLENNPSLDPLHKALGVYTAKQYLLDEENDSARKETDEQSSKDRSEQSDQASSDDDIIDLRIDKNDNNYSHTFKLNALPQPQLIDIGYYFYPIETLNPNVSDDHFTINNHTFLLQRNWGKGLITLASDLDFMGNHLMREADNAQITWHLVNQHTTPENVWLVIDDDMPNLAELIWRNAFWLIISATILLIIWLWHNMVRFGPMVQKPPLQRRRILEHITASGQFMWKHKQANTLLHSTQTSVLDQASRKLSGWHQLSEHERYQKLAHHIVWSEQDVVNVFTTQSTQSAQEFTRIIKQLESIRNLL